MSLPTIDFPNSVTGIRIEGSINSQSEFDFFAGATVSILNKDLGETITGVVELFEKITDNSVTASGFLRLTDLTDFTSIFWFKLSDNHQINVIESGSTFNSFAGSATSGIMCDYPYMWTYNDKTQMWRYDCAAGAWVSSGFSLIGGGAGEQGPQGSTGAQGFQGFTGPTGVQGFQGFQGPTGESGLKGEDGTSVRFIGSFTDPGLTSGTDPEEANGILNIEAQSIISGKSSTFVELREGDGIINLFDGNLWIAVDVEESDPESPSGISADWRNIGNIVGPEGVQGFQGFQGVTGPTGVQGFQGFQGVTGPTGVQGFQGFQGVTGPTGAISTINVNGVPYFNQQVLSFFSDRSVTSSTSSSELTITFGPFFAMVTGNNHTKEPNIARWQYVMQPSSFNGTWSVAGSTFIARNLMESGNGTTQAYGVSVTGPDGITLDGPGFSGFSVRRVPTGFSFEVIQKNGFFFFSAANPIDGDC